MQLINTRYGLILLLILLFIFPTPFILKALGFWHPNDAIRRLMAMLIFDAIVLTVCFLVWKLLL